MIVFKNKHLYQQQESNEISPENQKYIKDLRNILSNKTGQGLVNTILKKIPLPEMHLGLPNGIESEQVPEGSFNSTKKYSYCGPGTKVQQRLKEGYEGVNSLDRACKQHDIFYSKHTKTKDRNISDDILAKQAAEIALDSSEPEYVRNDAKLVTGIMGMKSRFGMGLEKSKNGVRSSVC